MQSLRLFVIFILAAKSLALHGSRARPPLPHRRLSLAASDAQDDTNNSNDAFARDDLKDLSLNELFSRIKDIEPSAVPKDVKEAITERIKVEGPSDLEIRMNILGITPLTIAGFGLAAVILTLNTVLGGGWAAELLHMTPPSADGSLTIERGDNAKAHIRRAERRTIDLSDQEIQDRIKQIAAQMDL